jgi:hypothetical protein
MLGSSKPVPFDPYGRRRSRWRVPRWLLLLLGGVAAGAAGVVVVQERYLPPRLSADASAKLHSEFEQADAERLQLKQTLGETGRRLNTALADAKTSADELAASRANEKRAHDDVAAVVAALPPDPRGATVEVRAARFNVQGGVLDYAVVLTRQRAAAGKPLAGVLQLVVAGASARGPDSTVAIKPTAVSIGAHEIVRGSVPLPEGFRPRETTVQVLDRPGGKALGMRVMLVNK